MVTESDYRNVCHLFFAQKRVSFGETKLCAQCLYNAFCVCPRGPRLAVMRRAKGVRFYIADIPWARGKGGPRWP